MKKTSDALIGDTFTVFADETTVALPGFKLPKPMVYAGVFPEDSADFGSLQKAVAKYQLEDRSIIIEPDASSALGSGFRCGFLGLLHLDIFKQRLEKEYRLGIITTNPSVNYRLIMKDGTKQDIININEMPSKFYIRGIAEPWVDMTIIAPNTALTAITNYCMSLRGEQ
jgi:GTP-binding protein LepA